MRGAILRYPEAFLFLALAIVWGSSYVMVGVVGDAVGPFTLVATRLAIGAIALGIVALRIRTPLPRLDQWPRLVAVGIFGIALPFTLIAAGQRSIDAGLASVIVATAPLLAAGAAALGMSGSRDRGLSPMTMAGLALGFAGVVIVASGGLGVGSDPASMAALAAAAACYAANGIFTRRFLAGISPMTIALGQAISALVVMAVLAVVVEGAPSVTPPAEAVAAIVWLGIMASAAASVMYFRLIAAWGPTRTTTVNYLTPLVGVAGGVLLLGERPPLSTLVGGAIIIAGVAMTNLGRQPFDALARRLFGAGRRAAAVPA